MEKSQFQKIMSALDNRVALCKNKVGPIRNTEDLSMLSIISAVDLKSFCEAEEEVMTKIVMVDLYHIIGMGKLTPPQMMKFTYAIQEYLQYRPTIKAIAKSLDSIFNLPKIPVETQYKLQGLGDITLKSDCIEHHEVDDASVEDYNKLKIRGQSQTLLLPFRIEGRRIKVDMTQFDFFVTLMTNLTKSPLSAENFRKKLVTCKEYLGIEWTDCTEYEATGCFKSADMYAKLSAYYNKRI